MRQQTLWEFAVEQQDKLMLQTAQHLGLTFLSLFLAILVGLPLGIWISRKRRFAQTVLGIAGVMQTVPSIALLGFMIPLFGIGVLPAVFALLIYALLPIIRNTYTGITEVNPTVTEAAKAMGMTDNQMLFKIEIPLAMPVIIAGIRTAAVINVGVATLASFVAAGGLGEFIFGGISLNNSNMILAGAIPAAVLAIVLDQIIALLQNVRWRNITKKFLILPLIIFFVSAFFYFKNDKNENLKFGFTPEFMGRQDGDLGLKTRYKLNVNPKVINDAVMYKAAQEGDLDVISGYSTDGRIKAFDLKVLEDDRKIFPPYFAAPIIKIKTLNKFPELEKTLNLLAGKLSDSLMTDLNYQADYLHKTPEAIASDFLRKNNLLKPSKNGSGATVTIGSKIFGEQYILAEIYRKLVEGYTDYRVETKTGLGGTKICFDALMNDAIDFYPEYTGTGLLVLLKPSPETVEKVSKNPEDTYDYVQRQFQKEYGIRWLKPLGFNNSYALMMRRSQAQKLKVKNISDLKKFTLK